MAGLFGSMKMPAAPPPPEPPTPLPTTDDAKVMEARKKAIADQKARQGRESTILSRTEKLGD